MAHYKCCFLSCKNGLENATNLHYCRIPTNHDAPGISSSVRITWRASLTFSCWCPPCFCCPSKRSLEPQSFVVISRTSSPLVQVMDSYCSTKAQLHSQVFWVFFFNFNFYYYFFAAKQQRLMDQLTHVRIKTKLRQREQTQEMLPGECLTKEQCSLNHVMHIVLKYMECVHV